MRSDFFNRINRGASAATTQKGLAMFGGSFEKIESSVKPMSEGLFCEDGALRMPRYACVMQTQGVNRFGEPFVRKNIRVYLTNPSGRFTGAFVSFNINPDSNLQPGQWLDIDSLETYKCSRNDIEQNGVYADGVASDTAAPTDEDAAIIDRQNA